MRLPAPVEGQPFPIHRGLTWGELADLIAAGRSTVPLVIRSATKIPPLTIQPACADAALPERTMLGDAEEAWLGERLATLKATWPTLIQQTVMTDLRIADIVLNFDQWDGYDPARQRLLAQAAAATDRLIVLYGDIHLAGIGVLPGTRGRVRHHLAGVGRQRPAGAGSRRWPSSPTSRGAEIAHRGYTRHVVTPERWTAEYRIVDDVADPASSVSTWQTFAVDASRGDVVTPI